MSTVKHVFWTFLSRVGSQLLNLAFSVFLARLLTPGEYGLMGMLVVITGFALILGEAGLNSALIYFNRMTSQYLATAFWMQLCINLVFTLLLYFGASYVADFYNNPILEPLTKLMSFNFILMSVGQIQNAILAQRMQFKEIGIVNFFATLISSIVALVLAYQGWGVWALAWQALSNSLAMMFLYMCFTRWLPTFEFSKSIAKELLDYGLYLVSHNALNYWMRNGDNLVIGKFLGAYPLGIYNRAYSLMLLPLQNIGAILGQVMFPTLAKIKTDQVAFRELYKKCIRLIAFISFPIMAGLSVLSTPIMLLLYGDQWLEAAPILQILSIVGLFQCIVFPVGWVFTALGKTKEQFHITVWLTPIFFVLIGLGMHWGILGVTYGYAAWAAISGIWNILAAGKLIGLAFSEYLMLFSKKLLSTAIMVGAVMVSLKSEWIQLSNFVIVVVNIAIGFVAYVSSAWLLNDQELYYLFNKLNRKFISRN